MYNPNDPNQTGPVATLNKQEQNSSEIDSDNLFHAVKGCQKILDRVPLVDHAAAIQILNARLQHRGLKENQKNELAAAGAQRFGVN